jgi:hypothetical protein
MQQDGPNSSPIQNDPSAIRCSDSMSKSPPVSRRARVSSLTIGKSILCRGSESSM